MLKNGLTFLLIATIVASFPAFANGSKLSPPFYTTKSKPKPKLNKPKVSPPASASAWLHPVLTLTGGVASARIGESQTFPPIDGSLYQYDADNARSRKLLLGAFVGVEMPIFSHSLLAAGLGYYRPSAFSGEGILTQGADAQSSDQYTYRYKVKSQQLLAEGKLLWNAEKRLHPYVSLGLGAAFNTAYDYQVSAPPFLTFTPLFSSKKTTAFTYSVGAGLDVDVLKNWRLGAGYRFSDLGKASLDSGQIDTLPIANTLSQSHCYVHEVIVQLSYLFS